MALISIPFTMYELGMGITITRFVIFTMTFTFCSVKGSTELVHHIHCTICKPKYNSLRTPRENVDTA